MAFSILDIQRRLAAVGLYSGPLDGIAGDGTDTGLDQVLDYYEAAHPRQPEVQAIDSLDGPAPIAWGAKVSPTFRERIRWICDTLKFDPNWLMACIAWESGETFSAKITNKAGSGATGLIQFMPTTAKSLGTTTAALAQMTDEDQLRVVYAYLKPFAGRVRTLSDLYMTILWPAAVGKPEDYAMPWSGITYRQNAGLDSNRNGVITKAEAAKHVADKLAKGLKLAE